ncbi:MAG: glycoside hydrolase family 3 C-terminal domain-containing protein [Oscillospiraceae bacterium]|jgi:beta-glucosidase|nr:glycoside hydrolase family 3 C-terminal domain-containing protein [Oscillospiraceae bacterium]
MKRLTATLCAIVFLMGVCALQISAAPEDTEYPNYAKVRLVTNRNGLVLGSSNDTGVQFIYDASSGYIFKDLNKNGKIDVYEDWREDINTRTADLLSQMPLTAKFALMAHNGTVSNGNRMAVSRAIGKGAQADGNSGNLQQRNAEATTFGIPYSYSSDPVHTGIIDTGANDEGGGGTGYPPVTNISRWPNTLGLANSFSADLHYTFGQVISQEYRNSQIFQQLGPLIDQSTHPTWSRISSAITEDYDLLVDLVQAEVSGMQTTEGDPIQDYGLPEGWGKDSISAMTKHLLGTGSGEFGYEGHTQVGGWLVYPGGGYEKLINTAADASGFGLFPPHSSKTANAGMTAYGIATGDDGLGRGNGFLGDKRFSLVGGGYSNFIMNEFLREGRNWDGMITSDWGIYGGTGASNHGMQSRFGVDDALRYFVSYMSGMSQTGGTGNAATCQLAYNIGVNGDPTRGIPAYGQEYMDALVDARAGNVIKTIMKCGLFENPYSDPDKADAENGSVELNQIAFDAHHQSIVMIKNHDNLLPIENSSLKAYAVGSYYPGGTSGYGAQGHDYRNIPEMADRYYDVTDDPAEADFGIVMLAGPNNGNGTAGRAQTAQFAPYTKTVGREVSIGGYWYHANGSIVQAYEIPNPAIGDYKENLSNIGFPNATPDYQSVLKYLLDAKAALGDKPIVLILNYRNAIVPAEFEPLVDAIVVSVEAAQEAFMNVISGVYEPTGMLAVTFPRSMDHIELSAEDVPDTTPYVDADNNVYQFGFGLNYSGRIVDERTEKYLGLKAIREVELLGGGTVKVPIELLSYKYGPTGVTATAYYDKADLTLVGFEPAPGYLLVGSGDQFTFANARAITTNTVIGYAIFEAANAANFDASKVTFAMDSVAWDIDGNPTMARFNDAEVSHVSTLGDVTLDGIVDVKDAVLLLQYLAGNKDLSAAQLTMADVNLDGNVTVSDVVIIMQMCMA